MLVSPQWLVASLCDAPQHNVWTLSSEEVMEAADERLRMWREH